jgi:hypothetical protein
MENWPAQENEQKLGVTIILMYLSSPRWPMPELTMNGSLFMPTSISDISQHTRNSKIAMIRCFILKRGNLSKTCLRILWLDYAKSRMYQLSIVTSKSSRNLFITIPITTLRKLTLFILMNYWLIWN